MVRVAVPIFRSRISPVFDSCTRVLLVDIEGNREMHRSEIYLDELSLTERVAILQKSGVGTVICGGISELMCSMLLGANIAPIPGIAGNVEQVVRAYLAEGLGAPQFQMPGQR